MRRPVDAYLSEVGKASVDSTVALIQSRVKLSLQTRNGGTIDEVPGMVGERRQPLFRGSEIAGQELALGLLEFQLEHECVQLLPTLLFQKYGPAAR